jgi:monothiol bacilliredoxin
VTRIITVESEGTLEEAFGEGRALIYKHSTRCWVSAVALRQVEKFKEDFPGTPIYQIDVIRNRELSQLAARRLEIPHASPQAILVVGGEPAWSATHGSVRAKVIARAIEAFQEAS